MHCCSRQALSVRPPLDQCPRGTKDVLITLGGTEPAQPGRSCQLRQALGSVGVVGAGIWVAVRMAWGTYITGGTVVRIVRVAWECGQHG